MSEEIKRPETELSEAALSDASGGHTEALRHQAMVLCMSCSRQCGEVNEAALAEYMYRHGPIINSSKCPFYGPGKG